MLGGLCIVFFYWMLIFLKVEYEQLEFRSLSRFSDLLNVPGFDIPCMPDDHIKSAKTFGIDRLQ